MKYSPLGSVIYIESILADNYIRISVRDEGPGISEGDQKKLFSEFQRLKAKPTGDEKSTGLGLAIVKKIVEYHYGIIKVESRPGEGSIFILELPITREVELTTEIKPQ